MKIIGFQTKAIEELATTFKSLWYAPGSRLPLVFKAPTGSGKTFMVTSFVHGLGSATSFDDDIAWIWITFSEELAMQSKGKFSDYFYPNAGRRLLTAADFSEGVLRRNDVLFINWQKLVAKNAKDRVLRRPAEGEPQKESGCYFEDVIEATHAAGRKIALVIDESHKNVTSLALDTVIGPINPKVVVKVSATPECVPSAEDIEDGKAGYVRVKRQDVVAAGLIKEAIVSQTEDELKTGSDEQDLDHKMLDLAMKRRMALAHKWQEAGSDVKPLVLIQLPDDDSDLKAQGVPTKDAVVAAYLTSHGVAEEKIAYWFDKKKSDSLVTITENTSPVEYLLFKYAAGTGWDCPRAQVLVMFREIDSPTFRIQTLGRILRNPEPEMDLLRFPDLRLGYLYTNYSRNMIETSPNKPDSPLLTRHANLVSRLANQIGEGEDGYVVDASMTSEFISRVDYGDLGKASAFQGSFVASMDKWFGLTQDDMVGARTAKLSAKGIDVTPSLQKGMIAGAAWRSDAPEGADGGGIDVQDEVSANDAEKDFTRACAQLLAEQTEQAAKVTNIARSAGVFRGSLRLWLQLALPDIAAETGRYKIFLKDVAKEAASKFRPALTSALKDYAPIRKKFVDDRRKREESRLPEVFVLNRTYDYSTSYEEVLNATLSAVQPFLLQKEYQGRDNEVKFIEYLEQQKDSIDWWFKNGNEGKDYFGLKYFNEQEQETALFYPDWIVKFKDGRIGIFDTKSGMTASQPQGREKGLHGKIESMNKSTKAERFVGGLVVQSGGVWYYHPGKGYSYQNGNLGQGWKPLSQLFS
ncbi:MAG: DEAD/DEAH box helicase [Kiritimatiellia bacterium]